MEAQRGESEENETVTAMASLSVAVMEKRYSCFLSLFGLQTVYDLFTFAHRTEDEPMEEEPPL